jgi:hypothetical protein
MKPHFSRGQTRPTQIADRRQEALSDQRFRDLIRKAGEFFTMAERGTENDRQVAIAEIKDLMNEYNLTIVDLLSG